MCLHWGACKHPGAKVICGGAEPECDYSGVPDYEEIEKSCDGIDNDCNNLIDDSLTPPLASKQQGLCLGQEKTCGGKDGWKDPNFGYIPFYEPTELTCDGLDNDCDGAVDIFIAPPPYSPGFGVCSVPLVCYGSDGWLQPGGPLPFYESVETMCDGLDNDCDGLTDEDMDTANFLGSGVSINNLGVCDGALIRCVGGVWSAPDYTKQPDYEAVEASCDGLDNDCDGLVDELEPALASKQAGVCVGQKLVCAGKIGWQDPDWTQVPGYGVDVEWQCDGLDNDCNSLTDEDAACPTWQVGGRGSGHVALSPDGAHLLWTTLQGAQVLYFADQLPEREWFGHHYAVQAAAFSEDGTLAATVGELDVLQVWKLAPDPQVAVYAQKPLVSVSGLGTIFHAVAFSPDGSRVAVGDASGTVRIYTLWNGQQSAALIGHQSPVLAVAWTLAGPDVNNQLLTGDENGVLRRWDVQKKTGVQLAVLQGSVRALTPLPGTTRMLVVATKMAQVLDADDGTVQALLTDPSQNFLLAGGALRAEPEAQALTVDTTGVVRLYALPTPTDAIASLVPAQVLQPPAETAGDTAASLAARGGHVAVGFVQHGPWQVDVPTATWTRATARTDGAVHDAAVTGNVLVTGGDDQAVRLWHAPTGQHLVDLWGHQGGVRTVLALTDLDLNAQGPDLSALLGTGLWLASGSDDFSVRLWSLLPGPNGVGILTPKVFGLGGPWPEDLARTADVPGLWAAGGPVLNKFAADPQNPLKLGTKLNAWPTKLGNIVQRVVPSPDGKFLAVGLSGDGPQQNIHYRMLNAKDFTVVHEWANVPAPVHVLAWSPTGARLAFAAADGLVEIAETSSGAVVQQLFGHTAPITALDWSPAGRLLSTSEDGTARVWSAPTSSPTLPLLSFGRHCPAPCSGLVQVTGGVWLDSAGRRAVTFASDGSVIAWTGPGSP